MAGQPGQDTRGWIFVTGQLGQVRLDTSAWIEELGQNREDRAAKTLQQ
jgi:hypothetical protein